MGADHQGKGFGTEAGRLLCMWAKSQGLGWIFASAYRDNVRSLRALERIGFSRLGAPAVTTDDQRVFLACPADRDEQATAHAFKAYRESETQ